MNSGTSETSSRPQTRLKKKQGKIEEVEAVMTHDNKIVYEEAGQVKEYVVDSMEDYRWALSEAQTMGRKSFEVSERLFDALTMGKDTPYLIQGNPAVFIYRQGTMERHRFLDSLTIEELQELRAKKAKKDAEKAAQVKEQKKMEFEL